MIVFIQRMENVFIFHPISISMIKPKFNFIALYQESCLTWSIGYGEDSKITVVRESFYFWSNFSHQFQQLSFYVNHILKSSTNLRHNQIRWSFHCISCLSGTRQVQKKQLCYLDRTSLLIKPLLWSSNSKPNNYSTVRDVTSLWARNQDLFGYSYCC